MLILNDGRKQLYQWDTGRTATVSIDCDIVHFSNLTYGEALAVQVKNGEVEIPNQLLTSGSPVHCWAFILDENGAYTKQEQTIDVIKRAKPSDYVYTQTEVVTIQSAVESALEQAKETKCDSCMNGWVRISENGYCAKCTLSSKKAVDCLTGTKSHYIQKLSIKGGANG